MNEIQRLWVSEYVCVCVLLLIDQRTNFSQMIGQKSGCLSTFLIMFYTLGRAS